MKKYLFYKTEIQGMEEVAETVRVIEKSAGSHIHFLKKKVAALSEYKKKVTVMLSRLFHFYWNSNQLLLKERQKGENVLLVFTGEKGIVGGLYHEIVNKVINRAGSYEKIWVVGSKGKDYLKEEHIQIDESFPNISFEILPNDSQIQEMSNVLLRCFHRSMLKRIDILYPSFVSLVEQKSSIIQFLPFNFEQSKLSEPQENYDGIPLFEPSKKIVFDTLLQKYIAVSFAEVILEAKLSECAARMVTAESAVKETQRLIDSLTCDFFKTKHLTMSQKQVESFAAHQIL